MDRFVFPKWVNKLVLLLPVFGAFGGLYVLVLVLYGTSPATTDTGYAPVQPVAYSHALHAGKLGIDCRYCHTGVEVGSHASIPPTQTCMNCHKNVRANSAKLALVREQYGTGEPIEWIRIHDLPDFAYFNHSAHVRRGVGCISCHGRIDKMEVVFQVETLGMAWCLDCHREPEKHLRPLDKITVMEWTPPEDQLAFGRRLREQYNVNPRTDCWTCHR
jgi:hypothetical protein